MLKPAFDDYQFQNRRQRAVSRDTGISFSDYDKMHVQRLSPNRLGAVPPFALDEKKLAEVLKTIGWRYIHATGRCPEHVSLEELKRDAETHHKILLRNRQASHISPYQQNLIEAHARTVEKAGGYLQLYATVAWQAWRRNMNSAEIAAETGIAPCTVRQYLSRMNRAARTLFPEYATPVRTHAQRMVQGRRTKPGDPNPSPFSIEEVVKLKKAGMSTREIAAKMGCSIDMVHMRRMAWEKQTGETLIPNRKHSTLAAREATIALLKNEIPAAETARLLGVHVVTVYNRRAAWEKETGETIARLPTGRSAPTTRNQKRRAARIVKLSQGLCGIEYCKNLVQPGKTECSKHVEYYAQKGREQNARLKEAHNRANKSLEEQHVHHESTNQQALRPLAEAGEPEKEQGHFAELQLA